MYKMYNGKEVCQGCKKTGDESPRVSKTDLCLKCEKALQLGLSKEYESNIEYVSVFQHYFAYRHGFVNDIAHKFLSEIHNEHAQVKSHEYIKYVSGSNGKRYQIDRRFFQPLSDMLSKLDSVFTDIENREADIPRLVKEEMEKMRDKVFNEGVLKGKQILLMLNSGEMSMSDFEKDFKYSQR